MRAVDRLAELFARWTRVRPRFKEPLPNTSEILTSPQILRSEELFCAVDTSEARVAPRKAGGTSKVAVWTGGRPFR